MHLETDSTLHYRDGALHMEAVALNAVADAHGTPCYVYSRAYIEDKYQALSGAFAATPHRIHYSVKANSNLAVLQVLHALGAGFDIVSGGELSRVLAIGADPRDVVFSGVGKSSAELSFALKSGIGCFNVESRSELECLSNIAQGLNVTAPVSLRVNPNVDAQTHPYISTGLKENKFGIPAEEALDAFTLATQLPHLNVIGIDCHIGSQINQIEPLLEALQHILQLTDELKKLDLQLEHIDLGGGMGVTYADEAPLDIEAYGAGVAQLMHNRELEVLLEPGRSLTANAGVLLTEVEYLKPGETIDGTNFAIVDAAMNDLIRPALYSAHHDVVPLNIPQQDPQHHWDIVGPVCESGDFLARNRALDPQPGERLAVTSAGAYGMVQASNYNSRPRACEVLVEQDSFRLIRRRETIADQLRLEVLEQTADNGNE